MVEGTFVSNVTSGIPGSASDTIGAGYKAQP